MVLKPLSIPIIRRYWDWAVTDKMVNYKYANLPRNVFTSQVEMLSTNCFEWSTVRAYIPRHTLIIDKLRHTVMQRARHHQEDGRWSNTWKRIKNRQTYFWSHITIFCSCYFFYCLSIFCFRLSCCLLFAFWFVS